MKAPFPWFGGKRDVAPAVWDRFGEGVNYVEPFFGSGAVLLNRPDWTPEMARVETVNDADGLLANAWRAILHDPEATAHYADWPVNENDLHARHAHLVAHRADVTRRLEGDPEWHDPKLAGWWLWGICCWIGGGWCSGNGPWQTIDGKLVDTRTEPDLGDAGRGVKRKLVHLGAGRGVSRQRVHLGAGQGVSRRRVHLGDAGRGVSRQLVHLSPGQGVHRQLVHLGNAGRGVAGDGEQGLVAWLTALAERLARVRVCCGDWARVVTDSASGQRMGTTAVFLDPPYSTEADRDMGIYANDSGTVAHDVREWCIANGNRPQYRIALCGYTGEGHDGLVEDHGWTVHTWSTQGGMANIGNAAGAVNRHREAIWFSPHCLTLEPNPQQTLWDTE